MTSDCQPILVNLLQSDDLHPATSHCTTDSVLLYFSTKPINLQMDSDQHAKSLLLPPSSVYPSAYARSRMESCSLVTLPADSTKAFSAADADSAAKHVSVAE